MLSNEERIQAMHLRASRIRQQSRAKKVMIAQIAGGVVCFAIVLIIAIQMSRISGTVHGGAGIDSMRASIFSDGGAFGFIVVAVVAFAFGAAVTIFCYRLKKWNEEKEKLTVNDRKH